MFDDLNHINVTNMRKKQILYASAFSKIEPLLVHLNLLHGIIRVLSYTLCGKSTLKIQTRLKSTFGWFTLVNGVSPVNKDE